MLRLTHGKEFSLEVYSDSFLKAKKTFYILGWRLEKIGDKYNLLKKLKRLVKRKIDVRIILTGSGNKKWELISDYIDEGINIKYLPLDNFSIFILDGKECKITLKDKTLMDKFNIFSIISKTFLEFIYLENSSNDKDEFNIFRFLNSSIAIFNSFIFLYLNRKKYILNYKIIINYNFIYIKF